MDLDELLRAMDRTTANLSKMDSVWERAKQYMPSRPQHGLHPVYEDLAMEWADLLPGLPPINGWTITAPLPDIDAAHVALEKPGTDLAVYRYRLERTRLRAVRGRLEQLISTVDAALPLVLKSVPRNSYERFQNEQTERTEAAIGEMARLLGDSAPASIDAANYVGSWWDLQRHMRFSKSQDWRDIAERDWPEVRAEITAIALGDGDPLPVPDIDLGQAASGRLTGSATLALPWERLDADGFERLLYDLLRSIPEHENVQWLMQTRAPDRGRDLSLDRVLRDGSGGVRTERVILQAKHWLSKSVNAAAVSETATAGKLWSPPLVRGIVIATSGRFTADAVTWAERHNAEGAVPFIDLWPDSQLETLLAQRPHIAAAHGLR